MKSQYDMLIVVSPVNGQLVKLDILVDILESTSLASVVKCWG